MNLAAQFVGILRNYGHNVYLRRRVDTVGSGPYMEVAGGKYEQGLEKWTVWRRPSGGGVASRTGVSNLGQKPEGLVTNYALTYYFQPDAEVKTSDLIIEDTPYERTKRQVSIVRKVVPYYFGANTIYLAAYCDVLDPTS